MTTSRIPTNYYTSDDVINNRNNTTRIISRKNNSHNTGTITNRTKNDSYNIVEKDFGDHKIIYHIPFEYGDNFDVSQLEDVPKSDEQQVRNSPKLVRRRIIQQYSDIDYDDDNYEYVEEVPIVTPRRRVYASPRNQRDTQVVETIYESQPPQTVEYIYEDEYPDDYDYRQENEEVEYVVRENVPKQIYMEEPRSVRRTVYVQDSPIPVSSPRPPPPPVAVAPHSPHRMSYQPSPRTNITQRSPPPASVKPIRRNEISPPPSTRKQQTARTSPIYEPLVKPNIPKTNEPPLRLMDIVAQNRAKRGARIPKPRREIDEEKIYDPPTYQRNIIKNGFIVHK